jgi:hypothetical protein
MQKPRIRVFILQKNKGYIVNTLAKEYLRGNFFTHLTQVQYNYFLPKTEEDHKLHLKNIGQ